MPIQQIIEALQILECEPGSSPEKIRSSYQQLLKMWNPDRFAHDPALNKRAQEKRDQINRAFEALKGVLELNIARNQAIAQEPPPRQAKALIPEELFLKGYNLYYGEGVAQDHGKAVVLLREAADMGYAKAQQLLGVAYYTGSGLRKNKSDAVYWWKKAAEQLNAYAMLGLGIVYNEGHEESLLAKFVKSTVDWKVGDSKVESYKWFTLAMTHGVGRKAGVARQSMAICVTGNQRNEARRRAKPLFPKYPSLSSDAVFNQLFDWFLEEGSSPVDIHMQKWFSSLKSKMGDLNNIKSEIRAIGVEHLRTSFAGNTLTKTGDFFKQAGSAWNPSRSSNDWARLIAVNMLEYPCDYLSDKFIQRRENAINQIWLNTSGNGEEVR